MDFWQHFFGLSHENNNVPVVHSAPAGEYTHLSAPEGGMESRTLEQRDQNRLDITDQLTKAEQTKRSMSRTGYFS